ncbi:MAG: DUF1543 domain-containing protein [Flavobacteriaceae bacterium]|nr:DUF1543 domain-containing protein [Flavobacteriaceae bacterium]
MKNNHKLFMIMLGCRPKGRFTEQHDIFFGIGKSMKDLIPQMKSFWPEAKGQIHVDVWREVTVVDNYKVEVVAKNTAKTSDAQLFFVNLGGYKENEFEEFHYKILTVATSLGEATKKSKETSFYKHCGFKGATSHIDDKYGVDIDDLYNVKEILTLDLLEQFELQITKSENLTEDTLHIGYLKLEKIE